MVKHTLTEAIQVPGKNYANPNAWKAGILLGAVATVMGVSVALTANGKKDDEDVGSTLGILTVVFGLVLFAALGCFFYFFVANSSAFQAYRRTVQRIKKRNRDPNETLMINPQNITMLEKMQYSMFTSTYQGRKHMHGYAIFIWGCISMFFFFSTGISMLSYVGYKKFESISLASFLTFMSFTSLFMGLYFYNNTNKQMFSNFCKALAESKIQKMRDTSEWKFDIDEWNKGGRQVKFEYFEK
jgi:hypothetical protein